MLALSILSSFRGLRGNTAFPRQKRPVFEFAQSCKKKTRVKRERDDGRFAPENASESAQARRVIRRRRATDAGTRAAKMRPLKIARCTTKGRNAFAPPKAFPRGEKKSAKSKKVKERFLLGKRLSSRFLPRRGEID